MKLVEATLYTRKGVESILHRCGSPCNEARARLFECQE